MTTEDDFQSALDANPQDWQTRLVFADWLQERNDPRAEGYRALGRQCRGAMACQMSNGPLLYILGTEAMSVKEHRRKWHDCLLPIEWFQLVPLSDAPSTTHSSWKYYATRREAEDAVALAFAQLPAERRAELLAGSTEARQKPARAKPKKKPEPKKEPKGKKK